MGANITADATATENTSAVKAHVGGSAGAPLPPAGELPNVVFLSAVHPEMLPPLYFISAVLAREGCSVDVFCFSSRATDRMADVSGVQIHDCGQHTGSWFQRFRARRAFYHAAAARIHDRRPVVIMAADPFSYLEALRLSAGQIPVVYVVLELYAHEWHDVLRSPMTTLRSRRALSRLREAALVCAPSPERSAWLAAKASLDKLPDVVLNAPSMVPQADAEDAEVASGVRSLERLRGRTIVLNSGNVSRSQAIVELIDSVEFWPSGACLVVTNVGDSTYAAEVRKHAESSTRRGDIVLLPLLPRREMLALQRLATVGMCLLRERDNMETCMPAPNKVGEYLHAGLIVVGIRMPFLDRLEQHRVAVLANRIDSRDISAAVTTAIARARDPATRKHIREVATTWYCMENQARPILEIVREASRSGSLK